MPVSGLRQGMAVIGLSSSRRLDGIAAILAATAVGNAGLLALLAKDSPVSDAARSLKRDMERT